MKILNISAPHPLKKAGIVVFDFHESLRQHGHESIILTSFAPDIKDKKIISYHTFASKVIEAIKHRIENKFFKKPYNSLYYYDGTDETKVKYRTKTIIKRLGDFKPDLIVIHFTQNFLSAQNIYELSSFLKVPVYWYLMDMKAMTGGCSYTWDCNGYKNACGACPSLNSNDPFDITYKNFAYSKKYLEKTDLSILVASEQLSQELSESTLLKNKPKYKMILGINENIFKPLSNVEIQVIRKKIGADPDKRAILFGASDLREKRKGGAYLMQALKILVENYSDELNLNNIQLFVIGNHSNEFKETLIKQTKNLISVVEIGFLDTRETLAEVFGASDIYISPSIVDSGPMMVNQSILCGIPVIAFDIGVAKDLVINKISGIRINKISEENLAIAIYDLITKSEDDLKMLKLSTAQFGKKQTSFEANYKAFLNSIEQKYITNE